MIKSIKSDLGALEDQYNVKNVLGLYGSAGLAARYCRLKPAHLIFPGRWQHGWLAPQWRLTPEYEFGEGELRPDMKMWLAREDQAKFLQESGFPSAKAIGLPCTYVPRSNAKRIPNSLIVVPTHSLDYTKHQWNFETYAQQISEFANDFDLVVAVIHKSCIKKNYWVKEFKERGIPIVEGAHTNDPSSLYRLEYLFSRFEYATTNAVGSHVAYSSLWGSKLSIVGTYAESSPEDYKNAPFYALYPNLIKAALFAGSEKANRENFPEFFLDHPSEAEQRIDWAKWQVGYDNRLSPSELRRAFGWSWHQRSKSRIFHSLLPYAEDWLPEVAKRNIRSRLNPSQSRMHAVAGEVTKLKRLGNECSGTTNVLGKSLTFQSATDCANRLQEIFADEQLKFQDLGTKPIIVIANANIGISCIYFAELYPEAQILAFEPDPNLFQILKTNIDEFDAKNVMVSNADLWKSARVTSTKMNESPSEIDGDKSDPQAATHYVHELLSSRIDFLQLDLANKGIDILEKHENQLHNIQRIHAKFYVDFSSQQELHRLTGLFHKTGFRLHVKNQNPAQQPFMYRPISSGCDSILDVFAIREEAH